MTAGIGSSTSMTLERTTVGIMYNWGGLCPLGPCGDYVLDQVKCALCADNGKHLGGEWLGRRASQDRQSVGETLPVCCSTERSQHNKGSM